MNVCTYTLVPNLDCLLVHITIRGSALLGLSVLRSMFEILYVLSI